jgi:cell division protease FtsH
VNDLTKNILVFIVIIVVLLSVVQGLSGVNSGQPQPVDYSEFLSQVRSGNVDVVEFSESNTHIAFGNRNSLGYYTINPETDTGPLIDMLIKNGVHFSAVEPPTQGIISQLLFSSFPILLLIGVWIYFMRQMQGGGGGRGAKTSSASGLGAP